MAASFDVPGWQVDGDWASASFQTGSFAKGVAFVAEIGRLADAQNHHPDVVLTYPSVTVRTSSHDAGTLTARDVELARTISAAAVTLGIPQA